MIFYFSGCGNSRFIAESISQAINEPLVFIPEAERGNRFEYTLAEGERVGFRRAVPQHRRLHLMRQVRERLPVAEHHLGGGSPEMARPLHQLRRLFPPLPEERHPVRQGECRKEAVLFREVLISALRLCYFFTSKKNKILKKYMSTSKNFISLSQ